MRWVFLLFFPLLVACAGSLSTGDIRSSDEDQESLTAVIKDDEVYEEQENTPVATTRPGARMDFVEYHIAQNLKQQRGFQKEESFPELESIFDSPSKTWSPRKGYNIPMVHNAAVDRWIRTFNGPLRKNFTRWISRASLYAPVMEEILREYNLPTDLVFLAMIESGFNLHAYSHANAAGPWQFIGSTGKLYGLSSGGMVDERRDLIKATRAAAAHLKDLHQAYGNWYLAFAAYNAGAGKVNGAIRKMGTKDYWKLAAPRSRALRQETKDYVPKILAAATIVKNYRKYGYSSNLFGKPLSFDVATVPDATDVSVIAKCAGVPLKEVENLNPALMVGVTPNDKQYCVMLPKGTLDTFEENYARVPKNMRVMFTFHKVKRNETLASLAKRYGIGKTRIAGANKLKPSGKLIPGNIVLIPNKGNPASLETLFAKKSNNKGEELAMMMSKKAIEDGKDLSTVIAANETDEPKEDVEENTEEEITSDEPQPESPEELTPTEPPQEPVKPMLYSVKRGDTLSVIAARNGVSLATLKSLNQLTTNQVKAGQILTIQEVNSVTSVAYNPSSAQVKQPQLYKVAKGDTLYLIAKKQGVSVSDLKTWNRLKGNTVYVGKNMIVSRPMAAAPVISKPVEATSPRMVASTRTSVTNDAGRLIVHQVRYGDTLWKLARRYRVTVEQLRSWNRLTRDSITPNQKIKIYAAVAPNSTLALGHL